MMTDLWLQAWRWLCNQRRHAPDNADIWHLRHHANTQLPLIRRQVEGGVYRLSPMQTVRCYAAGRECDTVIMWPAADALVLKWAALTLSPSLPVHTHCLHLQGGTHHAVGRVAQQLKTEEWQYVYRTDIRGYYRHIQKTMAWQIWQSITQDPACLNLLYQYLYYSVEDGGEIRTPETGIPRGCALSPLTGAVLLWHMDRYFGCQTGLYYLRYMDDFLLLARHRWPLKRAIRDCNQYLQIAGFTCHPDKTQIGRLSRGFDWCGIEFSPPNPPRISDRSLIKHRERCQRLDEQLRARGLSDKDRAARVQAYATRWTIWAHSLVKAAKCEINT